MCTAVRGVGPPAGKLTLWSIICDKAPVGEARCMDGLPVGAPANHTLLWYVHGLAIRHVFE